MPFAKLSHDDPTTVEVFERCINGQEISPGYTEQNDPIQQRATLEHQAGGEQQKLDEDFLVALEHEMPRAGGIGIGIAQGTRAARQAFARRPDDRRGS